MSNKTIIILGLIFTGAFAAFLFWPKQYNYDLSDKTQVVMYKNPGCQCCTLWAEHMMEGDYYVKEEPTPTIMKIKQENGISRELSSCHTAMVEGYVIEGHVPQEDVNRLLRERPEAIGLAVPGMPTGSPGMEMPGRMPDKYDVLLVKKDGTTEVYASH